ncbi:TetR/AcrR family transcriptional regulator [Streptomyces sp. NPDC056127]|uniref:TetR/AcrR family transcriptional regulator n=2 Tax=unclassified Streptomyces TaxID=2593676 RepID=UPI0035E0E8F9
MRATRRHGRELEGAISEAVMSELRERGYSGVTYDGVATRAATSKPVLYRRWPTRAEMVLAAVIASTTEVVATPSTGDLVQDLKALLRSMRDNFGPTDRSTMLGLLAESNQDAAETIRALIYRWGADLVEPVVTQARARGQLGTGMIPTSILALPFDLARHEFAIRGVLPDERIDTIVDVIVAPLMVANSRSVEAPVHEPT